MTFDNKISIDGVAAIALGIGALVWLLSLKGQVDLQGKDIDADEQRLKEVAAEMQKLSDNETALQINISVLTAIQKQAPQSAPSGK